MLMLLSGEGGRGRRVAFATRAREQNPCHPVDLIATRGRPGVLNDAMRVVLTIIEARSNLGRDAIAAAFRDSGGKR
jgi:hypothetical protein